MPPAVFSILQEAFCEIQYNPNMRKIIFPILLLLTIALIIFSFSELKSIVDTLQHSNWRFLIAAVVVELIGLYNLAVNFRSLYRVLEINEDSKRLALIATAANFVNVVAPSAGLGGMAVFIDDARKRNHPIGRVMVVGVLSVLLSYAAFLCVLALGLIVLIRRNNLNAGELTATGILLLIATGVSILFYLGYRSAEELGHALAWMARLVNRILKPFIHRNYLQEERAHSFAVEMADGINVIRRNPKGLIWPFLFSLNNFAILICVLAFTFLALGTPFSVGTLVGGFSIFYLFLIVSPTPSGLGVVEGIMPIALNTLRVKWEAAILITLVYRAITFWLPLALGAIAFRLLQRKPKNPLLEKKKVMDDAGDP